MLGIEPNRNKLPYSTTTKATQPRLECCTTYLLLCRPLLIINVELDAT